MPDQIIMNMIAGSAQVYEPRNLGGFSMPMPCKSCVTGPHGEYIMTQIMEMATMLDILGMNIANRMGMDP
ncbi:hypothetical protein SDC9_162165 [bioreactor metagenome]|uniref:Uncharacterized protein n=1 Tax=bioreactor metagenome TaxID=1076179 RepID=A0A645FMF4_9ZZZZ